MVAQASSDPEHLHQPKVKVISDPRENPFAEPVLADLAELDSSSGRPVRTILETTEPEKYGIQVADYIT